MKWSNYNKNYLSLIKYSPPISHSKQKFPKRPLLPNPLISKILHQQVCKTTQCVPEITPHVSTTTELAKRNSTSTNKNSTPRWISWLPVAPLYPYCQKIFRKPKHRAECWIIVTFCVIAGLYRELTYAYKDSFPVGHRSFSSTRMIRVDIPPCIKLGVSPCTPVHIGTPTVWKARALFPIVSGVWHARFWGGAAVWEERVFQSGESWLLHSVGHSLPADLTSGLISQSGLN